MALLLVVAAVAIMRIAFYLLGLVDMEVEVGEINHLLLLRHLGQVVSRNSLGVVMAVVGLEAVEAEASLVLRRGDEVPDYQVVLGAIDKLTRKDVKEHQVCHFNCIAWSPG